MNPRKKFQWLAAVGAALAVGLFLGGLWPNTPLHAVSTDRTETFAMATGPVDSEVEAVWFLDFLTGDLTALVLGRQAGTWTGRFTWNVAADLGVDPQKNPKYMMVTGVTSIRRAGGSRAQPSNAACYVAEITTGKVAAYAIPWTQSLYAAGQVQGGRLVPVGPANRFLQADAATPGAGVVAPRPRER